MHRINCLGRNSVKIGAFLLPINVSLDLVGWRQKEDKMHLFYHLNPKDISILKKLLINKVPFKTEIIFAIPALVQGM